MALLPYLCNSTHLCGILPIFVLYSGVRVIEGLLREGLEWVAIERVMGVNETQFQALKQQIADIRNLCVRRHERVEVVTSQGRLECVDRDCKSRPSTLAVAAD